MGSGGHDFWLLKIGPAGEQEWNRTYGGRYDDRARCISLARDGGYIVAGSATYRSGGKGDALILKLGPGGELEKKKN